MKNQLCTLPSAKHSKVSAIRKRVCLIKENYETQILRRVGVAVCGEQTTSTSARLRNIGSKTVYNCREDTFSSSMYSFKQGGIIKTYGR